MPSDLGLFLKQLVTKPQEIVALAPSSAALAQRMAEDLPDLPGKVAELGAGTGKITRALLAHGVAEEDLILYEMNETFCEHLRAEFPAALVRCTSAGDVGENAPGSLRSVVSGLPLLSFPADLQRQIAEGTFSAMQPKGKFIQFTYGPKPPMRQAIIADLGLKWDKSEKIWYNLPPARVYSFYQPLS